MLSTRIGLHDSKYSIPSASELENAVPYTPKEGETYTHSGIEIKLFWIASTEEHFHSPEGIKHFEIIRLVAEREDGKILDMATSSFTTLKLDEILQKAGIKFERRDSTQQIDESDKTANINSVQFSPPPDSWLARFNRWIGKLLFGF